MRRNVRGEFVIFSLRQAFIVDRVMKSMNMDLEYMVAEGQWCGLKERSVVVRLPDRWMNREAHDTALETIIGMLHKVCEHFLLYVTSGLEADQHRDAILISTDIDNPGAVDQGRFISVSREQAEKVNHTMLNGIYYTTEKTMEVHNGC